MTSDLWLRDLWLFGLQTAVVVSAAALVVRVCRLQSPRALLAYWRTVLLVVLMLPICQTWVPAAEPSRPRPPAAVAPAPLPDVVPATAPHTPTTTRWPAASRVLVLLGSGVLLRGLWMIAGVISLRRLRIDARPLDPVPASVAEIQSRLATKATFLLTGDATGPMTYGVLRPVVFLPQRVAALPDHVLQAVAAHELIHVRRRDWVEEVFIEGVVTLLWFHPGVRWLAGRIRLSREHVVDDEVIRRTASRERYADALLRVSLDRRRHGLLPAPAFHRQSALKQRLAHILQETAMTRRRIVASLTAGAAVVGLTALIVTRAFPLQAQVPDATGQASAAPVQVVKGGDHLLHGELPEYPARAVAQHVEGDVALDLFVDERGEVSDARVSSGPEELRRAALSSVLTWHYAPSALSNAAAQAVLRFRLPAEGIAAPSEVEFKLRMYAMRQGDEVGFAIGKGTHEEPSTVQKLEHQIEEMRRVVESDQTSDGERLELKAKLEELSRRMATLRAEQETGVAGVPAQQSTRLDRVRSERVSNEVIGEIMRQAGLSVGSEFTEVTFNRVRALAAETDEHVRVELGRDERGGAVLTFIAR